MGKRWTRNTEMPKWEIEHSRKRGKPVLYLFGNHLQMGSNGGVHCLSTPLFAQLQQLRYASLIIIAGL
jgi:hypothetical protein